MEHVLTSKYVKEDTAEVLKTLGQLAKQEELWHAIKEIAIEYMRTEQAYAWLLKELAKIDANIIEKGLSVYPELLERAENALRVHSAWRPIGVRERAENARILALQEVGRFIEEHKEMQKEKICRIMEIQAERLKALAQLLGKLRNLVSVPGALSEYRLPGLPGTDGRHR